MLEFTGERLVPEQADLDLLNEHLARYAFATRLARGKRVLDIASGAGYGSAALAAQAAHVTGVDISPEAVQSAAATYRAPNLAFQLAPAQNLPFEDHSFDLIVAYEVIEHLDDYHLLLAEARRLLAPGGQFVVSTPNKSFYAESRRLHGPNPFHVHEFEYDEFLAELSAVFPSVTMFLQNHVSALSFHPAAGGVLLNAALAPGCQPPQPETSHFFLAVCALAPQTGSPAYLYLPASSNLLRERELHILKLESELAQKDAWLETLKQDHSRLHDAHQAQLAESEKHVAWARQLETELDETRQTVLALQAEFAAYQASATETAAAYQAKVDELDQTLIERTQSLTNIQTQLDAKIAELSKCVELLHAAETTVEERTAWVRTLEARVAELEQTLHQANGSRWLRFGRRLGVGPDLQSF